VQQRFTMLAQAIGGAGTGYAISHTSGGVVADAAHVAQRAMDNLAASCENAGGKASASSKRFFDNAQAMAEMAKKAQEAADKGESVKPKEQIEGMMQIAASAILTYKERAALESVYYAAKSAASFADGNFWAGAEFALSSGLFAEAAGTSGRASSNSGGGGGSQSSYGRSGSGGSGGSGSGSGGGAEPGGASTTIHLNFPGGTLISPDTLPQIMTQMSSLARNGTATLDATNALYNGNKLG